MATEEDLLLFHLRQYVKIVGEKSKSGQGYPTMEILRRSREFTKHLSSPWEARLMDCERSLVENWCHFFNPVGGLHHARKDRAGGFCVFNDAAVAIAKCLKEGISRVRVHRHRSHSTDTQILRRIEMSYQNFHGSPMWI